jgi:hypothetical protein
MGKSNHIRAAVIDDLTFDPDVDAQISGSKRWTGRGAHRKRPELSQYVQAAAVAARAAGVR